MSSSPRKQWICTEKDRITRQEWRSKDQVRYDICEPGVSEPVPQQTHLSIAPYGVLFGPECMHKWSLRFGDPIPERLPCGHPPLASTCIGFVSGMQHMVCMQFVLKED